MIRLSENKLFNIGESVGQIFTRPSITLDWRRGKMDIKAIIALALSGAALLVVIISLATDHWADDDAVSIVKQECYTLYP